MHKFKSIRGYNLELKSPQYKVVYPKPRLFRRFDVITGGGYGLKTYILSWRELHHSTLWPQIQSHFNSNINKYPYYKCYASPRLQSLGGLGFASGGL